MDYDWRAVQARLKALGFDPGPVDGLRGPRTNAAIVAFKVSIGFRARDYYGPLTNEALFAAGDPTDPDPLPWMALALSKLRLHEGRDNAILRAFLASDGKTLGDPAKLPWCGDFVETVTKLTLPAEPLPGPLGQNPYWARNWLHFGRPTAPTYGAVAVFSRGSGGHVGWLLGEQGGFYRVLGGNQSDSVTDGALIDKGRLLGARWPMTWAPRLIHLPRYSSGGILSTNEA